MIFLQIISLIVGLLIVGTTLFSAIETFVLPRSAPDQITRVVFLSTRWLFMLRMRFSRNFRERDWIMGFFAPVSLLALLPVWLSLLMIGFASIYWGLGIGTWYVAIQFSVSSLLTLGFANQVGTVWLLFSFMEATIGLIMVALLIAYLPTMYGAFQRRESAVTLLEVRAGNPPSAKEMIQRYHRIHGLEQLTDLWRVWENWFADIEESHTSLPALVFFRSPQPDHSWVTASGAVLDAASLVLSSVDVPANPQAALCIRAGFLTLRHIAEFFAIPYPVDPHYPQESISIQREEWELVCAQLAESGVPLKEDREQAWLDFAGWRVNYDVVLLALAGLTMAPYALWSSDRATGGKQALLLKRKRFQPSSKIG